MKRFLLLFMLVGSAWSQTYVSGGRVVEGSVNYCADAGGTDTYACSLVPALRAYQTGACYTFLANTANTGAASLNLNSLGAKPIKTAAGADPSDSNLASGGIYTVCYDGTNMLLDFDTAGGGGGTTPTRNAQTGTTYTLLSTDDGKVVTFSNAATIAVELPQATGDFGDGWFVYTQNVGVGLVTITPTTSTINGAATITLGTNSKGIIFSDGTDYLMFQIPIWEHPTNTSLLVGTNAGAALAVGADNNTIIGVSAFDAHTGSSDRNTVIGFGSMGSGSASSGTRDNVTMGFSSGTDINSGEGNVVIGSAGANDLSSGDFNTILGDNTASGGGLTTASRNIYIGADGATDETGSNTLIIDNADRGSEAAGRTDSLIYGIMSATVADQRITFNAAVEFNAYTFATLPTVGNGVQVYCSDCDPGAGAIIACASSGAQTGAMAMKIAGNWDCMSR